VAVVVSGHGVARAKPARLRHVAGSDEGLPRGLFALPVRAEDARAADPELAARRVLSVFADDARVDGGQREADAARLARAGQRVRHAYADLGHAEALERIG